MNRIDVRYNGELVPLTPLTSPVLARSGQTVEVADSQDETIDGGTSNGNASDDKARNGQVGNGTTANGENTLTSLNWEETVLAKQRLIDNWDKLSGEEVLAKLESIWTNSKKTTPRADLAQNLDLCFLKLLLWTKLSASTATNLKYVSVLPPPGKMEWRLNQK